MTKDLRNRIVRAISYSLFIFSLALMLNDNENNPNGMYVFITMIVAEVVAVIVLYSIKTK